MCRGKMNEELIRCQKLNLDRTLADVSFGDDADGMWVQPAIVKSDEIVQLFVLVYNGSPLFTAHGLR